MTVEYDILAHKLHIVALTILGDEAHPEIDCHMCGNKFRLKVNLRDWKRYASGGDTIQACFSYLTPSERELILSGTCDPCWDLMWPEDDE
jgi:hypothetical protein